MIFHNYNTHLKLTWKWTLRGGSEPTNSDSSAGQ
jgi:hypothetical protein